MVIQRPARTRPQGEVEGERSHGGNDLIGDDTMGTTFGDAAINYGDPGGADELKSQRNSDGPGDREWNWGTRGQRLNRWDRG